MNCLNVCDPSYRARDSVIALSRNRTARTLPAGFRGSGLLKKNFKLMDAWFATGGNIKFDAKLRLWKTAKARLKAEANNKCAYCEADTAVVAHGDVEHFRPKTKYWWLAYCYDNYTFSCQICNQTFKGDEFPITGPMLVAPVLPAAIPPTQAAQNDLAASFCMDPLITAHHELANYFASEYCLLVNPYFEDPELLFAWEVDQINKEVILKAGASRRGQEAYAAADEYLGLNREELRKGRYAPYAVLELLARALDVPELGDDLKIAVLLQVLDMTSGRQPYTGMLRYFAREWGLLPPL